MCEVFFSPNDREEVRCVIAWLWEDTVPAFARLMLTNTLAGVDCIGG